LDPGDTPLSLVDLLLDLNVRYALFVADAGLLGPRTGPHTDDISIRAVRHPERNDSASERARCEDIGTAWIARWRQIAEGADRIIVPCPQAEAFAVRVLSAGIARKLERHYQGGRRRAGPRLRGKQVHLGVVPVRSCVHEQRLIIELARALGRTHSRVSITVLGATFDDIALMRECGAFVTGKVAADEFNQLIADLAITNLFISASQPIFAHPSLSAVDASGLPVAYLDWSEGRVRPDAVDLALDPDESVDGLAAAIGRWTSQARDEQPRIDNRQLPWRQAAIRKNRVVE
jgi:hypothetical protein